jgi:elongation factor Ts
MAQITAALVKQLRDETGAGMMECKKALTEAEGDIEAAVDVLRTRGLAAAQKKAGRATNEGVVAAFISQDGTVAALAEVNCETDFVARTDKFRATAVQFAQVVAESNPIDSDEFVAAPAEGGTVSDMLTEAIHIIGENMQLGAFAREKLDGIGLLNTYVHGVGNIGVIVKLGFTKAETAKSTDVVELAHDIAMQVAAVNPVAVDRSSVPADVVAHEKAIYKEQAAESGKPEAIQEKMAEGRLGKYFKESCLVDQEFVKDPDKTIQTHIDEVSKAVGDSIVVLAFDRLVLGAGA